MICDLCRSNVAKYKVTRYLGNKILSLALCEDCYRNLDSTLEQMQANGAFNDTPCPDCKTSFSTISATGKFGCPTCYTHFKDKAASLLSNIHGGAVHKGKRPAQPTKEAENPAMLQLDNLRAQLQRCIANQEFEQAALIRDQIKDLEAGL